MTPLQQQLRSRVREVPDFPQPGVGFKDLSPLWADPTAFAAVVQALRPAAEEVELLVAIEARGFLLGAPLALAAGVGLAVARKPGKLPGPVEQVSYDLEYGSATLQLQAGAVAPGQRVLVVDDVLATGGTAAAAAQLVAQAGATPTGLAVVIELSFLSGRTALPGLEVTALLDYNG